VTKTRFAVAFEDHFGVEHLGGCHYEDKARAALMVRHLRKELRTKGPFTTGAIPGGGVCVAVRLTVAPSLDCCIH